MVATLTLVQDVTANAALLTLLAGPRWAIGPRDLALLGRRAAELAGSRGRGATFDDVRAQLRGGRRGRRPDRDRLAGRRAGVARATSTTRPRRGRGSACWPPSCAGCASAIGEPILDLVRRIIDTTGIDVELASSVSPAAAARRDNLDLFVQAVSEFQAVDGQVTLAALLAWLEAEDEFGQGLDVATPSEADSVKLLTVHRAKGLEWDAVFLVGVTERKFPTNRTRSSWLTVPFVMPVALRGDARDLPALAGHTPDDIAALARRDQGARGASRSCGSATSPGPARGTGCPSRRGAGRRTSRPAAAPRTTSSRPARRWPAWGGAARAVARRARQGRPQPLRRRSTPTCRGRCRTRPPRSPAARRRGRRGCGDALAADEPRRRSTTCSSSTGSSSGTTSSTGCSRRRAATASPEIDVPLPSSLSATSLARLRDDPEAFAARPGPADAAAAVAGGPVRHPLPRLGGGRFGQQLLLDPDELPGPRRRRHRRRRRPARADQAVRGRPVRRPRAARRRAAVRAGARAARWCAAASTRSTPSRVDGDGYLVVDWKTNRAADRRPAASSRSTASPGPSSTACPSSGSGRRSTTSAPATARRAARPRVAGRLEALLRRPAGPS